VRFAVRPSRQPGASPRSHSMPCGDVPGRVHISVERGGAGEAGEDRLALAVARRDIPTSAASLRGVRGGDFLDSARSLGFQAPDHQAPAGPHDLPVQPGLGGDVSARLADGPLRRPGRALDPQVLNTDDVEPAGQISGDLLTPVLPRVSLPGLQPGDRASGDLAVPRSRLRPGQPALQQDKPALSARAEPWHVQQLASRQSRAHGDATVHSHYLAGARHWERRRQGSCAGEGTRR